MSRPLCQMKAKYERDLKPTHRIILDQIKIAVLQAFHSFRGAHIAHDVLTGKVASMRQVRKRLNGVCTLEDFISDAINALDMWMTEGGDYAETQSKLSAEKESGLQAMQKDSSSSPVPESNIAYNHRQKWTDVKMLKYCRLNEKSRLKVYYALPRTRSCLSFRY
jgi:hypothetical protein